MKYPYKLNKEERQILRDVEAGKFVPIENMKKEVAKVRGYALNTIKKTKNINIRLAERDVLALKERAMANNLPYQTLISTLIRQYLSGKFKIIL